MNTWTVHIKDLNLRGTVEAMNEKSALLKVLEKNCRDKPEVDVESYLANCKVYVTKVASANG